MPNDTLQIGSITIAALADGSADGENALLAEEFPEVPAAAWEPHRRRVPRAFADEETWAVGRNVWLVRTPSATVLVDAGQRITPDDAPPGQGVPAALARHGVAPEEIDLVFLTHLDIDHVGWLLTPEGQPTFPLARHAVTRTEWEHVGQPAARTRYEQWAPYLDTAVLPLASLVPLDLVEDGATLGEGLTVVGTPGHTPGHASLLVAADGERVLLLGDVAHHPAQLTETEWSTVYDDDPALAATTRSRIAAWAADEGVVAAGAHFPHPGFGRLVRHEGRPAWVPLG